MPSVCSTSTTPERGMPSESTGERRVRPSMGALFVSMMRRMGFSVEMATSSPFSSLAGAKATLWPSLTNRLFRSPVTSMLSRLVLSADMSMCVGSTFCTTREAAFTSSPSPGRKNEAKYCTSSRPTEPDPNRSMAELCWSKAVTMAWASLRSMVPEPSKSP